MVDKKTDIVLVYPFLEKAVWKNELRSKDNLAIGYLSSVLKKAKFSVKVIHAEYHHFNEQQVCNLICKYRPTVVGFSCTAQRAYPIVKKTIELIQQQMSVITILGGIFPTVASLEIMNDCPLIDAICVGEGEELIVEFMKLINQREKWQNIDGLIYKDYLNNIHINKKRALNGNLDNLPFPTKDFLKNMQTEMASGLYYFNINAGRGCYGNCKFCSIKKLYFGKRRVRSVQNVVDEIEYLINDFGAKYIKFVDEIFIDLTNLEWISRFVNEVKKREIKFYFHIELRPDGVSRELIRQLVSIGLHEVFIGLEAGTNEILKLHRKGTTVQQSERALRILNDFPIKLQIGYIMIDPRLSFKQLKQNFSWLTRIEHFSKHNLYNKLNIYFGTDLYAEFRSEDEMCEQTFFERKKYRYKDQRVELFSQLVDFAKDAFEAYNKRVNSFILKMIHKAVNNNHWQIVSEEIEKCEIRIWIDILNFIMVLTEDYNRDSSKLERFLNTKIQDCQNKLEYYCASMLTPEIGLVSTGLP